MTPSHLSTTQVQASLQEDAIPFGFALGLILVNVVFLALYEEANSAKEPSRATTQ
jgi:hypothetical protein